MNITASNLLLNYYCVSNRLDSAMADHERPTNSELSKRVTDERRRLEFRRSEELAGSTAIKEMVEIDDEIIEPVGEEPKRFRLMAVLGRITGIRPNLPTDAEPADTPFPRSGIQKVPEQ